MSGGLSLPQSAVEAAGRSPRSATGPSPAFVDPTEVRLLGRLHVRRRDGSAIGDSEWRSRKNLDLFRILALSVGEPISVDRLVDMLWPGTAHERSRASLRTAASQLRGILGYDAIRRGREGLELENVWVDTNAFLARARASHQAHLEKRAAQSVASARQAEALYLRDLEIGEYSGEMAAWFATAQQRLIKVHTSLMVDAGMDALSLGWLRDASHFAERAMERDPYCEEAYRIGMLALAGIGEVKQALALYSRCKRLLGVELGVDPAAQTQAAYLQILRSGATLRVATTELVGRDADRSRVLQWVREASRSNGGCLVVIGPKGGGSSSLVRDVASELGVPLQRSKAPKEPSPQQTGSECVAYEGVERWRVGDLRHLLAAHRERGQHTTVLAAYRHGLDARADDELEDLRVEGLIETVFLDPLDRSQVDELARQLLSGALGPELLDTLIEKTGGLPGAVVETVQAWLSRGQLLHTSHGLDLVTEDPGAHGQAVYRQLRGLHEELTSAQQTVLGVVAVLGRTVSAEAVTTVLVGTGSTAEGGAGHSFTRTEVERALSYLQDLAVLKVDSRGRFTFENPLLRDVVCDWLRPAALRALHHAVALRLNLSPGARVDHWLRAGEPGLACASALEAANTAVAAHDFTAGRLHLTQACDLIDREIADPSDLVGILTQLAVCADRLGLDDEAQRSREEALQLAQTHDVLMPDEPSQWLSSVNQLTPKARHTGPLHHRVGISLTTPPSSEAEALLRTAYTSAVRRGDHVEASEARALIAGLILLPRRQFVEAGRLLARLGSEPVTPLTALSHIATQEAGVLLGDPGVEIEVLDEVRKVSPGLRGLTSGLQIEMLCALARHDQGRSDARTTLDSAIDHAMATQPEGPWRYVAARMLVERREYERADSLLDGAQPKVDGPTAQILVLVGKAAIALAQENPDLAERYLHKGIEKAQLTGATLMLPEMASRLVALGRDPDVESAIDHLDLAERSQGEVALGRERVTLALARAAVRAKMGRTLQAAEVAGAAAELATALGLGYSAVEARERRQAYLDEAYNRADTSLEDVEQAPTKLSRHKVRRLSVL